MISAVLLLVSAQFCPSYTMSSASNNNNCGVEAVPGTNPTPAQWQAIFALVSQGPSAWGTAGPAVANIGQGCGKPMPTMNVAARFPCELLKAIAMQESSWKQFCVPTTPADQVGKSSRTIISFDCGYGIGQVTSGMHNGESPAFNRALVAGDPTYNMATGTQILAAKWKATQCVGDNQPSIIEDWYTATWAYNGLAYSNNPSNPAYSSTRGIYNPSVGGSRPYQEKVFGWMEHPPSASYWNVTAVAYPNPATVGSAGSPPALAEPSCSTPTNCTATRAVHVSSCFGADGGTPMDGGMGGAGGSGGSGGSGGGSAAGGGNGGGSAAGGGSGGGSGGSGGGSATGGGSGGGSAAGGGSGGSGGGSAAGGGNGVGGGSATGGGSGGGAPQPTVTDLAHDELGVAAQLGCSASAGGAFFPLVLLLLGARRRR